MARAQFKAKVIFGHVRIDAWLEWRDERLIGMGMKRTYDEKGDLVDIEVKPTGLEVCP